MEGGEIGRLPKTDCHPNCKALPIGPAMENMMSIGARVGGLRNKSTVGGSNCDTYEGLLCVGFSGRL